MLPNWGTNSFCTPPSSVHVTVRVLSNLHYVQGAWAGGRKVLTLELGQNVDPNRSPNFFQTRQQSETKLSLGCSIHNSEQQALKVQTKKHDNTNKPNIGSCQCPFFEKRNSRLLPTSQVQQAQQTRTSATAKQFKTKPYSFRASVPPWCLLHSESSWTRQSKNHGNIQAGILPAHATIRASSSDAAPPPVGRSI